MAGPRRRASSRSDSATGLRPRADAEWRGLAEQGSQPQSGGGFAAVAAEAVTENVQVGGEGFCGIVGRGVRRVVAGGAKAHLDVGEEAAIELVGRSGAQFAVTED